MFKSILLSIFRHALTGAGGAIVAQGVLSSDQLTQLCGAGSVLVGVALSLWDKFKAAQANAAFTPPKYNQ